MNTKINFKKIKYYTKCTFNIFGTIFMIFHTIITPMFAMFLGLVSPEFAEFYRIQYPKESIIAFGFLAYLFFQDLPKKQKKLFQSLVYINIFPGSLFVIMMLSDKKDFGLNGLIFIVIQIGLYIIYWRKFPKNKEILSK